MGARCAHHPASRPLHPSARTSSGTTASSVPPAAGNIAGDCPRYRDLVLEECGVAAFGAWEKELPKFLSDPRYKALPTMAERRGLFDTFVRGKAEAERKRKAAGRKAAIEGFRELLAELGGELTAESTLATVAASKGLDPRFAALEVKDKEALLAQVRGHLHRIRLRKIRCAEEAVVVGRRFVRWRRRRGSGGRGRGRGRGGGGGGARARAARSAAAESTRGGSDLLSCMAFAAFVGGPWTECWPHRFPLTRLAAAAGRTATSVAPRAQVALPQGRVPLRCCR